MKLPSAVLTLAVATLAVATPAFAADPAVGEADFKRCKSCHAIIADDGTAIMKGGKIGPNLYGIIGRQVGALAGFSYGASIIAAGADGSVWDQAMVAAYVVDPTAWLQEKTGDPDAKSKMAFKLKEGGEDIAAYLASVQ